jgi:hypothetical protein
VQSIGIRDASTCDFHAEGAFAMDKDSLVLVAKAYISVFVSYIRVVYEHVLLGGHVAGSPRIGT